MARRPCLAALALTGTLACAAATAQTAAPAASEAERLVFVEPHLAQLDPPRTLRYRYRREGGAEAALDDEAALAFSRTTAGGCCAVRGRYLSGAQAVDLPDIEQAQANPIVLYFLEQQVRELHRRTRGSPAHFRRRIRLALADAASVSSSTIRWGGRELPARTVRIAPFVDDPYRARFESDALTEYSFVLSDAVPGGVYQLRAGLPGVGGASQKLTLAEPADRPSDKR